MGIPVAWELCTFGSPPRPTLVVGVTHPQTCLILSARLRRLRNAGFQVVLIASPGALLERVAAEAQVEFIPLPMERGIAPWADLRSLLRLVKVLLRIRPQIAEFSTPKAGLLGMLAATFCGVPRRIYLLRGLRLETVRGFKRRMLLWSERIACGCAHVVLCNSHSLRAQAVGLRLVRPGKVTILGQGSSVGVDLTRFRPGQSHVREDLGWSSRHHVIGFVGRLTRDKGLPELIEAFERVASSDPLARLLLVGWFDAAEDALSEALRLRIANDPRIRCTGFVCDTAPYYRAMDVMVLPTWREGFPNAVLEAQASVVPVITTLATGSRDSVIPEVTGLLIPAGSVEAITDSVRKLLGDEGRRQQMGRAARRWVREHYADHKVLRLNAEFYSDMSDALRAGSPGVQEESARFV
ncbi:MAG: glycosyltransferase family 4 protein [Acidobacteriota bacterium]